MPSVYPVNFRTPDASSEFFALQDAVAGRYSLDREIGRGGMGIVFVARDVALDRLVALKLLPPALAIRPELAERFLREARTVARLSHPHIVTVHTVEQHRDLAFFTMMYVDGETLGQRVRRAGPLKPSEATRLIREVAWALAYAHANGVVHRDVKPDNILIERGSGRALVTDFGIARLLETSGETAPGEMLGTAHYMSPEQAGGDAADARSDLYALGVTAFFALTGRVPFEASTSLAVLAMHVNRQAPSVTELRPGVPAALADAVSRCLAKSPEERFASGEELAEAVNARMGDQRDVPASVRMFVAVLGWLKASGIVAAVFSLLALMTIGGLDLHVLPVIASPFALVLGVLLAAVLRARSMLRAGMDVDDLTSAYVRLERFVLEDLQSANRFPVRTRFCIQGIPLLIMGGSVVTYSVYGLLTDPNWRAHPVSPIALAGFGLIALWVGVPRLWLLYLAERKRKPIEALVEATLRRSRRGQLLIARGLFKLASIGIKPGPAASVVANDPTEFVLASAAEHIFGELPPEYRGRFRQVPEVLSGLRAHAHALRQRASRDAGATRGRERLALVVAALENIRLDLLRLKAGTTTAEALTADLDAAEEISRQVNADLDGVRAVDALLSRH